MGTWEAAEPTLIVLCPRAEEETRMEIYPSNVSSKGAAGRCDSNMRNRQNWRSPPPSSSVPCDV
jgi:hypothetical protein